MSSLIAKNGSPFIAATALLIAAGFVQAPDEVIKTTSLPTKLSSILDNSFQGYHLPQKNVEEDLRLIPEGFIKAENVKIIQSKEFKEIDVTTIDELIASTKAAVNFSFHDRVEHFVKLASLNKSQLAAVLNVERKSIYDWKRKPEIQVRESSRKRIEVLESFVNSMDVGHSVYIAKMAFGSTGHQEFANELTKRELDLVALTALYDKYWNEFDGYLSREKIQSNTKTFDSSTGYGELV